MVPDCDYKLRPNILGDWETAVLRSVRKLVDSKKQHKSKTYIYGDKIIHFLCKRILNGIAYEVRHMFWGMFGTSVQPLN